MKENSCRLKLSAEQLAQACVQASDILTWKSTCHFWLGPCWHPGAGPEGLNPAGVTLMQRCRELSWEGWCSENLIISPRALFLTISCLWKGETWGFCVCLFVFLFSLKEEERAGLCGRRPGQERRAWCIWWYKTPKRNNQQSWLSATVLLCLSPVVIKIISATCCRVDFPFPACIWCRAMVFVLPV